MRINHNIAAMNTYNKLTANTAATSKSLEKLSSGLKINRAGDNAAGLAISEKMRAQVRGLDQASTNSQDGISLIQTAEGALNETHSILQRMRELAVQSSTDTNTTDDRSKIQSEMDELAKEITRISNTTEYNTQSLVNGAIKSGAVGEMKFHIGANADQNVSLSIAAMDAKSLGVTRDTQTVTVGTNGSAVTGASLATGSAIPTGIVAITAADINAVAATSGAIVLAGAGNTLTIGATTANGATANGLQINITGNTSDALSVTATGNTIDIKFADTTGTNNSAANIQAAIRALGTVNGVDVTNWTATGAGTVTAGLASGGITPPGVVSMASGVTQGLAITATNGVSETVNIATNATSVSFTGNFNGLTLTKNSGSTTVASFGATNLTVANNTSTSATFSGGVLSAEANAAGGINVSTQAAANTAITTIDDAIKMVSSERGKLGAYQNRLEHTINNLGTSSENLSAAESRIRDVDMAKEMMEFQKNNILNQASTAMLAQANQQPQGVLQLLQ